MKLFLSALLVVLCLTSCHVNKNVGIWMVGDSTMAKKKASRAPESGWGEGLKEYTNQKAKVHNHAASGRSSLSFITENRWKNVKDSLQKGDYVILQFGHNDEKAKEKLHTEPFGSFQQNMKMFIIEAREKGAIPIICSSIVRRHFDEHKQLIDTHGDYIIAAKEIVLETNTAYVDMESLTHDLVLSMGPEKSKEIYNFSGKKQDSTHLNFNGASVVAALFVKEVKKQHLPLAKFFRVNKEK
ncbi:rhamnogalacturonan acetylesterase [Wenyingzhuangia sp. IMCC45467]